MTVTDSNTETSALKAPPKAASAGKKWLWVLLPIALLGVGFLVRRVAVQRSRSANPEAISRAVERKNLPITVTANGTVEAERSINLSPKASGTIAMLLVEEGDRVGRGEAIAIMDDSNLRGELVQMQGQLAQQEADLARLLAGERPEDIARAQAQLAEAEAQLAELRSGNRAQDIDQASARVEQARATVRQREADVQRYEDLFAEGAIARETLEQFRTDRDVARSQLAEAESALALQQEGARQEQIEQAIARVEQQRQALTLLRAGSRQEDIARGRAQVQAAQGSLQVVEARLQDTQVVAPFDGVVLNIYAEVGSFVSPSASGGSAESASSSSILLLSSSENQVVVNLPESQIAKVQPDQAVAFEVDAFPGESFTGQVDRVAAQATLSQNVTSFEVWVDIDLPAGAALKPGMNVEADFAVGSLDNALLVPNAAVVRRADGEGVYVVEGDRQPTFQPIQTGATADGQTQVLSGLDGDERVLVSPPADSPRQRGGFAFPPRPPQ
ncbi:MAG: efflux RND transporter periplasmic adaptor subunit [Cyanobacteria bacterium J06639_1]